MKDLKLSKFMIFLTIFAFLLMPISIKNNAFAEMKSDDLKITARSALLVDYDSGEIVYEKNSNEKLPIASMTKIASLAVIFNILEKGIIKENDMVLVSEKAASVGGSSAFLDAGARYKVSDLVRSIIIASANDSTVALSEFVSGSEGLFVSKMNKLCLELDLKDTHFENSTGLPVDNHYSTANDLVKIYKIICNNPLYKRYSKIWMSDFVHPSGRKTGLVNTNRLIKTYDGVDGGKTGYTDNARFCLTASASRGDTRFVGVIIGANDSKTRFSEMSKLFNYGFANFENKILVNEEVPIASFKFKNTTKQVAIYPEGDVCKFLSKNEDFEFSTDYEIYDVKPPIKQGDVVGKMFVFDKNNMVIEEVNLISKDDANEIGFLELFNKVARNW